MDTRPENLWQLLDTEALREEHRLQEEAGWLLFFWRTLSKGTTKTSVKCWWCHDVTASENLHYIFLGQNSPMSPHLLRPPKSWDTRQPSAQQAVCMRFSCPGTHTRETTPGRLQRFQWVKLYTSCPFSQTVFYRLQTKARCHLQLVSPPLPQTFQECSSWGAQLTSPYLVFPRWQVTSSG